MVNDIQYGQVWVRTILPGTLDMSHVHCTIAPLTSIITLFSYCLPSLTCSQDVEDARLVLTASRVGGEAEERAVVERSQRLVGEHAGPRWAAVVVATAGNFDRLGRIVEEPFVAEFRARIGFHSTDDFHILGPRHAEVARQSRLAHGRICSLINRRRHNLKLKIKQ